MDCRVFELEARSGPWNMAWDAWMLEHVGQHPTHAAFRTYSWSEPTLSLGYFQSSSEAKHAARWSSVPLVRRATGGGAILHDQELTYAIAIPTHHPLATRAERLYDAMSGALISVLRRRGFSAERRGQGELRLRRDRPFLCFLDQDASDVVVDGIKIIGSAQRRRGGALLQHGSLLLKTAPLTPEIPGLDRLGLTSEAAGLADWDVEIREAVFEALGLNPVDEPLSAEDRERIPGLCTGIFEDQGWTDRR